MECPPSGRDNSDANLVRIRAALRGERATDQVLGASLLPTNFRHELDDVGLCLLDSGILRRVPHCVLGRLSARLLLLESV